MCQANILECYKWKKGEKTQAEQKDTADTVSRHLVCVLCVSVCPLMS